MRNKMIRKRLRDCEEVLRYIDYPNFEFSRYQGLSSSLSLTFEDMQVLIKNRYL